jgi:hypothetical protein
VVNGCTFADISVLQAGNSSGTGYQDLLPIFSQIFNDFGGEDFPARKKSIH